MKFEKLMPGSYAMVKATLATGEGLRAESGAMVSMSPTIDLESQAQGGLFGGLKRMVAGESFFCQTLKAVRGDGEAILAPSAPGDIELLELSGGNSYFLERGAFLACGEGVNIDTNIQGVSKGLFSGEGFFLLSATGTGPLAVAAFGAIYELNLAPGQEWIVDNGHLVAWSHTVNYSVEKATKGWVSSFTSGEGLVCRFRGPGRLLIQSRNDSGFGAWVRQFIPAKG